MQFQYLKYFNGMEHIVLMLVLLVFVWVSPNIQQLFFHESAALNIREGSVVRWCPNKRWMVVVVLMAVVSILKLGQVSEFLYFQF